MNSPSSSSSSTTTPDPCAGIPSGDAQRWFRDEIEPHGSLLRNYLRGKFPNVRDVDDVVQESYLRVWKRQAVKPIASAKAFLFKAARHLALDLIRRRKAAPFSTLSSFDASFVIDDAPNAAEALSAHEKLDLLAEAVAALPERCRGVILLHKIDGLSQREVAARLDMSERTVANHCYQGVKRCEEYLRARRVAGFRQS